MVFSKTPKKADDEIIGENFVEEVRRIKSMDGKDIWLFGGASLVASFINENLVDEFRLAVQPVVLGAGKPLFKRITHRLQLKLKSGQEYDTGLVFFSYLSK